MSKPIYSIEIITADAKKRAVNTVFDTGSFYTIIREDCIPEIQTIL